MNINEAMLIDIDNCIVDTRCQEKYFPADLRSREGWDNAHKYIDEYTEIQVMCDLLVMHALANKVYPIFITSREDINGVREATEALIAEVFCDLNHILLMRKAYDYRSPLEVKSDLLIEAKMCCDKIVLGLDDREDICKMYSDNGIPTLQFRFGKE